LQLKDNHTCRAEKLEHGRQNGREQIAHDSPRGPRPSTPILLLGLGSTAKRYETKYQHKNQGSYSLYILSCSFCLRIRRLHAFSIVVDVVRISFNYRWKRLSHSQTIILGNQQHAPGVSFDCAAWRFFKGVDAIGDFGSARPTHRRLRTHSVVSIFCQIAPS
jgi:hypothetical protein